MLVLSRKLDETIVLPDLNLTIRVAAISGGRVRLAVEAPHEVRIVRQEVLGRSPTVSSQTLGSQRSSGESAVLAK